MNILKKNNLILSLNLFDFNISGLNRTDDLKGTRMFDSDIAIET